MIKKRSLSNTVILYFFIVIFAPLSHQLYAQDTTETGQKLPSPRGALLRSVVLPGWGQAYNHKYLKAVGFFAVQGYFTYKFYDENNTLQDINDQNERDQVKYDRNTWAWRFLAGYVICLADAYVDAQLASFPKDDSISLDFHPLRKGWLVALNISIP